MKRQRKEVFTKNKMTFEIKLQPRYDSRASFYGKAKVRTEGNKLILTSYSTDVAQIEDGKATVFGEYSLTTMRHIKEFLKQNNFKVESSDQVLKDYKEGATKTYETPTSKESKDIPLMAGERAFKINDKVQIVARQEDARDGFNHTATLYINGKAVDSAKVHYINRTWESYEFQTVMQRLVDKTTELSDAEKQSAKSYLAKDHTDWSDFKTTGMVAQLGEVFGKTTKEKNDWKERMLKAGLGGKGLEMPEDWDTLDEKTKEKRLDAVIKELHKVGEK
jgi:hypothetical protein